MKAVSYTSQWTAAARALETERTDALFYDSFARSLAEPKGFELLKKYGGGGLQEFVAIRTKFIDDTIESLVMSGFIRQIVLVASGMDTRAYRLVWPEGATVYEVDHIDLFEEKHARLNALKAKASVDRRVVPVDLKTEWLPALFDAGFNKSQPTLWVVEALLFFLSDSDVKKLLTTMASVSAPMSRLTLDVLSKNLLQNISSQFFLNALRADDIPWLFGTNEPEDYFLKQGWMITELKEPGQEGVGKDRWPYKLHPRNIPNISRNWLINAEII